MLREMLSQDEIKMIDYMRIVATENERDTEFSVDTEMMPTYNWLRFWDVQKSNLSAPFCANQSLILKKKVNFCSSQEEIESNLKELFYCNTGDTLIHNIAGALGKYNNIIPAAENDWRLDDSSNYFFVETTIHPWNDKETKNFYTFRQFMFYKIMVTENVLNNKYEGPDVDIYLSNSKTMHLQAGMKITRLLGKLAKYAAQEPEFTDTYELFEEIRIKHSQIMNESKLTGTLCISIHPLDYMTASYNNNDWRSCMHWEDGEFRRGVIEMMNSFCVICAYLESNHENVCIGPSHVWNSKKWREFFIVTPELIAGIKGYPYWNKDLELITLNWLRELYNDTFNTQYDNQLTVYRTEDKTEPFVTSTGNTSIKNIEFNTGSAMYNDFYNGNDYNMYLATNLGIIDYTLICNYSGASECVWCGEVYYDFDCEQSMMCNHCTNPYFCSKCGERIRYRDDLFEIDNEIYCRECYNELPVCDCCGETYLNDNRDDCDDGFVVGYNNECLLPVNKPRPTVHHICDNCADIVLRQHRRLWHNSVDYYHCYWKQLPIINPEELTPEGKTMLDITHAKLIDMYHHAANLVRERIYNNQTNQIKSFTPDWFTVNLTDTDADTYIYSRSF